ncbi:MAG TPA: helix-turn-helix transcriptional regulator [Coxiellaceae bacterium]|nr:helix-turn-helix transcriptional regulator [Coxiellaceae bacterium]
MRRKNSSNNKIEIIESSGNVFKDLNIVNPEEHLIKAELAVRINKLIDEMGLKQNAAAELLDIDQPKISALTRGRLSGFSVERLLRFLAILNQDIEIIIKPRKGRRHQNPLAHVRIKHA